MVVRPVEEKIVYAGLLYRVWRTPLNVCERRHLLLPHNAATNWVSTLPVNVQVVAHYDPPRDGYVKVVVVSRAMDTYRQSVYVDPACLQLVNGPEIVWVKRIFFYHDMAPTYTPQNYHRRMAVFDRGALDCRWSRKLGHDRHDLLDLEALGQCTGHCRHVAIEIMQDDDRLADILAAASVSQENLTVFCGRGRHMSMAAAEVIRVFTLASVMAEYPFHWCHRCPCLSCYDVVDCLEKSNFLVENQPGADGITEELRWV